MSAPTVKKKGGRGLGSPTDLGTVCVAHQLCDVARCVIRDLAVCLQPHGLWKAREDYVTAPMDSCAVLIEEFVENFTGLDGQVWKVLVRASIEYDVVFMKIIIWACMRPGRKG